MFRFLSLQQCNTCRQGLLRPSSILRPLATIYNLETVDIAPACTALRAF